MTELVIGRQAHAQTYPAKPIRFILSYPPGGSTDTLGRIVAKVVSDAEGVNVIADNRPGASGSIGTSLCAKSPPDGYTMCMVSPAQTIASRLSANAGYDSLKDLSQVTLVATVPMLLLVHPSLPGKERRGTDRAREAQAGRPQLRIKRRRRQSASRDGTFQATGRPRHHADYL